MDESSSLFLCVHGTHVVIAQKTTHYLIFYEVHNTSMSTEEKQKVIHAWDKHLEETVCKHKFASFSSVAEEVFCEAFRNGIIAHGTLTKKEKLEICAYSKL